MCTRLVPAAVSAVCVAGLLGPAQAVSPSSVGDAPAGGTVDTASPGTSGTPEPEARVTLITGDVIGYYHADGRPMAKVISTAPRPDGHPVTFFTMGRGDEVTVIPSDAQPLVRAGQLDRRLFDVAYLAENGYSGAEGDIPVIVRYASSTPRSRLAPEADALPATSAPRALASVDGAAVNVAKDRAQAFWNRVAAPVRDGRTRLGSGLSKIWLDGRVRASLDESVSQIRAPEAWAAGFDGAGVDVAVLDTGVDLDHPDFAGRIAASKVFTGEESVQDGYGHGTHVASIVAGSGAASDGKHKGVAPGADLLVGKVLSDAGSGSDSQVIAGMQWAAESGARLVNMSLGGPDDGADDPVDAALDDLSARYKTLFVVAAGNSGPRASTVSSPGSAEAALTVAAVDKSDAPASFSSRGPRTGTYALKPDIAAPGVDITAARAAGTDIGPRVGDTYTRMSGTSMATPHVAGAAAILAEQHPDWSGERLKAALVSTAKDVGHGAYELGSGRVDVARAVSQGVYATGNVDFRQIPADGGPITKQLGYVNDTDEDVTLTLKAQVSAHGGSIPPDGTLTVPDSVTVPARGSTTVPVRFDRTAGAGEGRYEGRVEATDATGSVEAGVAVGATISAKPVSVDLSIIPPEGAREVRVGAVAYMRVDNRDDLGFAAYGQQALDTTTQLPAAGPWSVHASVGWVDENGQWNTGLATVSQFSATDRTSLTIDMGEAKEVTTSTPKPAEPVIVGSGYLQIRQDNLGYALPLAMASYPNQHLWVSQVDKPALGTFSGFTSALLGSPLVSMTIGTEGSAVHPWYQAYSGSGYRTDGTPRMLDGERTYPVVAAGHGLAADFEGVDADGRIVLLDLSDICQADGCTGNALDRVQRAEAAGAAAVLGYGSPGAEFLGLERRKSWALYPIPTLGLSAKEGARLSRLAQHDTVRLHVDAHDTARYVYPLAFDSQGTPPWHNNVAEDELAQVDDRIYSEHESTASLSWSPLYSSGMSTSFSDVLHLPTRSTLTEYIGPVSADTGWQRDLVDLHNFGPGLVPMMTSQNLFDRPGRRTQKWMAAPLAPGAPVYTSAELSNGPAVTACNAQCRSGDLLVPYSALVGADPTAYISNRLSFDDSPVKVDYHLYRDGSEIPFETRLLTYAWLRIPFPTFRLGPDSADYRMTMSTPPPWDSLTHPQRVDTAWTFKSAEPTSGHAYDGCYAGTLSFGAGPCAPLRLLDLRYDASVDLDNTVPAGRSRTLTITGYHPVDNTSPARLDTLSLEVSFDGGEHWSTEPVRRVGPAGFAARIVPPSDSTGGSVSYRVKAADTEGHTIEQTVLRGYDIR
jgi:subtilisin family serine protease